MSKLDFKFISIKLDLKLYSLLSALEDYLSKNKKRRY